jgi:hypothetical protein
MKDNSLIFERLASNARPYEDSKVVVGPAEVILSWTGQGGGFCTLEITPDFFAPDRTVVIPQGGGATIMLQSTTNLMTWTNVFSQSYSNVPANQFFRISVDRVPQ